MEDDPSKWFYDPVSPNFVQLHAIEDIIYSGKTRFQSVEIIHTSSFGKCLVLDGKIQSSEMDEFIYHEALAHPPMITHPHPETVFIAGGGEGATLREVLAHASVKRAVMVDVDQEAVDICTKERDIDIVLLDMQVPGMSGYDAAREIRKSNKDLPIIAQSAFILAEDKDRAIEAGCNAHISKPLK